MDRITLSATRFGNQLIRNHGLRMGLDIPMDLDQSAQVQRALILKAIEKRAKNDNSNLTFFIDASPSFKWPAAADGLADALRMSQVPVDTVCKSYLGIEGLKPFLSGTGKRFIYDRARIVMGPPKGWYNGPVHESNARVRLYNEKQRDMEWLIMDRTGKTDRAEVQNDLSRGDQVNAISALAYGTKGLVDAVIVGEDEVLSRKTLDEYYAANNLTGKARDKFNGEYDSIDTVVEWARANGKLEAFKQFSAKSVSDKPSPLYKSALDNKAADKPATDQEQAESLIKELTKLVERIGKNNGSAPAAAVPEANGRLKFHNHVPGKAIDTQSGLTRHVGILAKENRKRVEVQNVPKGVDGFYLRDTVYFPQGFDVETGNGFEASLLELYEKKRKQQDAGQNVQNLLIVENSPGGASTVTEQLKSVIEHAPVKTDVLIQGMGASGGSKLVSMATGNRFATPNSVILLHETRGGASVDTLDEVNASNNGMNYSAKGYMQLVAKRSGRPFEEVRKDFKLDFWVNAVESIVYGSNGLIDAILVDKDQVITREAVMDYIIACKGSKPKAEKYIQQKFEERRSGENPANPEDHLEAKDDPLSNPLQVVEELVRAGKAQKLADIDAFKPSTADTFNASRTLDLYTVLTP